MKEQEDIVEVGEKEGLNWKVLADRKTSSVEESSYNVKNS